MKNEYHGELLLYPCPVTLVTSLYENIEDVLTVSWTGIASSHPEYVTVAINKKRYSHKIISNSNCFCINIPNIDLIKRVDYCGSVSGRNVNKFEACDFNKEYYLDRYITIKECPVSILCDVKTIVELGSHDLFISKVVRKLIDSNTYYVHNGLDPITYIRPTYHSINKNDIGYYGYSMND